MNNFFVILDSLYFKMYADFLLVQESPSFTVLEESITNLLKILSN